MHDEEPDAVQRNQFSLALVVDTTLLTSTDARNSCPPVEEPNRLRVLLPWNSTTSFTACQYPSTGNARHLFVVGDMSPRNHENVR